MAEASRRELVQPWPGQPHRQSRPGRRQRQRWRQAPGPGRPNTGASAEARPSQGHPHTYGDRRRAGGRWAVDGGTGGAGAG